MDHNTFYNRIPDTKGETWLPVHFGVVSVIRFTAESEQLENQNVRGALLFSRAVKPAKVGR